MVKNRILLYAVLGFTLFAVFATITRLPLRLLSSSANWKTYTNTNPVYSLKYPTDWKIDSSNANLTPSKDGAVLSISKGDTIFQVVSYTDGSSALKFPNTCQFSDSNYRGNLVSGDKYTEIKSGDITYRITQLLPIVPGPGGYKEVCSKQKNEEKFSTIIGRMNIRYNLPENYIDGDIDIMNLILSSFRFQ